MIVKIETGHVIDLECIVIVGVLIDMDIWPVGYAVLGGYYF